MNILSEDLITLMQISLNLLLWFLPLLPSPKLPPWLGFCSEDFLWLPYVSYLVLSSFVLPYLTPFVFAFVSLSLQFDLFLPCLWPYLYLLLCNFFFRFHWCSGYYCPQLLAFTRGLPLKLYFNLFLASCLLP